jgi:HEAT repeat protein
MLPEKAFALARSASPHAASALAACAILAALGKASDGTARDVQFLSAALSNDDPLVRRESLGALAVLGGHECLDPITFALTDEESEVRLAAVRALGRIRTDDGNALGVERLTKLVEGRSEPDLLPTAVRALGEARDARALGLLCKLVLGDDVPAAVAAVEALGSFETPNIIDTLIEATRHGSAEVVKASLLLLTGQDDARVMAHVGACLDHEAWDVRRLAADLLSRLGEKSQELLRSRQNVEQVPLVRDAIRRALDATGAVSRSLVPPGGGSWPPR